VSLDADASVLPSGEKVTVPTDLKWPLSVCSAFLELASYSLIDLSFDADTSVSPFGEKVIEVT
jgi:hypothetical protein